MTFLVHYKDSTDTAKHLSPSVWADCPNREELLMGPRAGWDFYDDFLHMQTTAIDHTTIGDLDAGLPYAAFNSSGGLQAGDDATGGGLVLTEATDGQSSTIFVDQTAFKVSTGEGAFWFEARIKIGNIVTNATSWAIGLMDSTPVTAIIPITASGVLADVNFLGFVKPEVDTTTFDAVYKANGVTAVEVNGAITAAPVVAADVYFKVGMKVRDNILRFYVNGLELNTTKTLPTTADGTDFPDDINMQPVMTVAVGAGAGTDTLTCDWWRFVQLRAGN